MTGYMSAAAGENCICISDCTEQVLQGFEYASLNAAETTITEEDSLLKKINFHKSLLRDRHQHRSAT